MLTAVHEHPAGAETLVVLDSPAAAAIRLVGDSVNVQPTPACVTVNGCPAIVIVPLRGVVAVFAEMLYPTVPLPEPLDPLETAIHEALLAAVHAQPVPAVTVTLPVVAVAATDRFDGEIDGEQGTEYENAFDSVLAFDPPGPTAVTRASNVTPGVGGTVSSGRKSTRITPVVPGLGLPRSTVAKAVDDPCG